MSSVEADSISSISFSRHFVPGFHIPPLRCWPYLFTSARGRPLVSQQPLHAATRAWDFGRLTGWAARRRPPSRRDPSTRSGQAARATLDCVAPATVDPIRSFSCLSGSFQDGGEEAVAGVDSRDRAEIPALRKRCRIGPGHDSRRSQAIEFGAAIQQMQAWFFFHCLLDYIFVFFFLQGTGRIDHAAAGGEVGGCGAEDR